MKYYGLLICILGWCSPIAPSLAQSTLKPVMPRFAPDPQVYRGTTDPNTGTNCQGMPTTPPGHILTIERPMSSLSLRVFAASPVTIKVRGKEGTQCRSGRNPEILGAWSAGKYEIWIGAVNGDRITYELSLSEASQPEEKNRNSLLNFRSICLK